MREGRYFTVNLIAWVGGNRRGNTACRAQVCAPSSSRNDVRGELVLDCVHAIAQQKPALFQALNLQHVGSRRLLERFDGSVEISMFLSQARQLRPQLGLFFLGHCRGFTWVEQTLRRQSQGRRRVDDSTVSRFICGFLSFKTVS
jgi:hypothetical protein